ncbi:MAG: hypothetical protein Q9183_003560, partial [Haloplaca sp. 2 TL-2023]
MAKFSIRSSVDLNDPKLEAFFHHLGDQVSIINDIASYDKEKQSYDEGDTTAIINVVNVIAETEGVEAEPAK